MRLGFVLLFGLLWAGSGRASEWTYATASQGSSLQKREISARAAALGGNGSSMVAGADSVMSNPAALARLPSLDLGVHHQSWLAGINQENLTAAAPAYGWAWGLGLGLVDYGQVDAVDEFGQPLGSIGAQDYSVSLAGARAVGAGLSIGSSARVSQQVLADERQIQGMLNLGLHWMGGGWQAGVLFANVASSLLGGDRGPAAVRAELSGNLLPHPEDLRLYSGFSLEPQGLSRFQVGLEATIQASLMARAGYEARLGNTLVQGFNGATFGLGFAIGSTVLDYAYLPFGDLGAGHRVSLKWRAAPPAQVHLASVPRPTVRPTAQPTPAPTPWVAPTATAAPTLVPTALPTPTPQPTVDGLQFKTTEDALELARAAEEHGNLDEAVALHEGLLGRFPHNAVVWRSLGDLNYRIHHKAEAVKAYDRAFEEGLENSDLQHWLEKYRSQP